MTFPRCAQLAITSSVLMSVVVAPPAIATAASPVPRQQILEVQSTLEALALDPGPVDGTMGPRTKAALIRFQQREGLPANGTLDEQTRVRLSTRRQPHVRDVQKALTTMGLDPGPGDGVMGPRTKAALRAYATAPAPAPPTAASQAVDRFRRAYDPSLTQSP